MIYSDPKSSRRLAAVLGCLMLLVVPGCGFFGAFYGIFIDPLIPPPTVEAEHTMNDARVLIWVDDAYLEHSNPFLRRTATQALASDLLEHNAVGEIVEYARIAQFRQQHPDLSPYTIQQIGQELDADQVLYLLLERFQLQHDAGPGYYRPELTGYAKVLDVATGKRLWPVEQTKLGFHYQSSLTEGQAGPSDAIEQKLLQALADTLAADLGPRFYKHPGEKR